MWVAVKAIWGLEKEAIEEQAIGQVLAECPMCRAGCKTDGYFATRTGAGRKTSSPRDWTGPTVWRWTWWATEALEMDSGTRTFITLPVFPVAERTDRE